VEEGRDLPVPGRSGRELPVSDRASELIHDSDVMGVLVRIDACHEFVGDARRGCRRRQDCHACQRRIPFLSAVTPRRRHGSTAHGTIAYTRDAVGNLTGTTPSNGASGSAQTYAYNANQQLTGTTTGSTTTSNAYDAAGNPTTVSGVTEVFDAADELCWTSTTSVASPSCASPASGATTYTTNTNGERTAKTPATGTATSYSYNAAEELTGVSGTTTASYAYDGDGLRASKTVSGTTTPFTWDTATSTPELLSDGTNDYVYGPTGVPVEQFSASGTANPLYYFTDAHGSTVELTNSSGAVAATYTYTSWGAASAHTGSSSTPILFAGAYVDAETGLLYLQSRYYDPATALFLSVDPLVAQTLQAYLYVGNNPLNLADRTGMSTASFILGAISAAAGIAGLFADGTVVGVPLGLVFEGISFGTGLAATSMDCGWWGEKSDPVACGLDTVGLVTGGLGAGADLTKELVEGAGIGAHALSALNVTVKAGGLLGGCGAARYRLRGGRTRRASLATTHPQTATLRPREPVSTCRQA
jgi:RHS repeat-associated protein